MSFAKQVCSEARTENSPILGLFTAITHTFLCILYVYIVYISHSQLGDYFCFNVLLHFNYVILKVKRNVKER